MFNPMFDAEVPFLWLTDPICHGWPTQFASCSPNFGQSSPPPPPPPRCCSTAPVQDLRPRLWSLGKLHAEFCREDSWAEVGMLSNTWVWHTLYHHFALDFPLVVKGVNPSSNQPTSRKRTSMACGKGVWHSKSNSQWGDSSVEEPQ